MSAHGCTISITFHLFGDSADKINTPYIQSNNNNDKRPKRREKKEAPHRKTHIHRLIIKVIFRSVVIFFALCSLYCLISVCKILNVCLLISFSLWIGTIFIISYFSFHFSCCSTFIFFLFVDRLFLSPVKYLFTSRMNGNNSTIRLNWAWSASRTHTKC